MSDHLDQPIDGPPAQASTPAAQPGPTGQPDQAKQIAYLASICFRAVGAIIVLAAISLAIAKPVTVDGYDCGTIVSPEIPNIFDPDVGCDEERGSQQAVLFVAGGVGVALFVTGFIVRTSDLGSLSGTRVERPRQTPEEAAASDQRWSRAAQVVAAIIVILLLGVFIAGLTAET